MAAHHNPTLSLLTSLEAATSELRHAILTNKDTAATYNRLTSTMTDLARQLEPATPQGLSTAETLVTKPVTISPTASKTPPPATPAPATAEQDKHHAETRPARHNAVAAQANVVKTIDMNKSIGPGWTLVQRHGDADASVWHVQHNGNTAGTVRRSYDLSTNTRGWEARTARYDLIRATSAYAASRRNGSLWRTRDTAAASVAARLTVRKRSQASKQRRPIA